MLIIMGLPLSLGIPSLPVHAAPAARRTPTAPPTATTPPTATPSATSTHTPTPTATTAPLPSATSRPSSTLFSDNFESDAIGSIPAGWTVTGTNAGFTVQQN